MLGEYLYNGNGQRADKLISSQNKCTVFHYDQNGLLITESTRTGNIKAEYVYLNGQPLAKIENNNVYYYHNDHLGTPMLMTDNSGSVVWQGEFLPFGEPLSVTGTVTNNLRFPGQYYDAETGDHYNINRTYDPDIGRYHEADPIGLLGGVNLFIYVSNSPVNWVDPWGLKLCKTTLPGLGETYLDDAFTPLVLNWIEINKQSGMDVVFTEAFRTTAYQQSLSKNKNAITPAKGGSSLHEAGFAVDISWKRIPKNMQNQVVENAKKAGLKWGGNFKKKADPVHFYNDPGNRKKRIKDAQRDYEGGVDCECP